MSALLLTILATSALGGAHCAGMCGGFVSLACGTGTISRVKLVSSYNFGRLIVYVALGVIAGTLGNALNAGAAGFGLQRGAAALAGLMMALFGLAFLLQEFGVARALPAPPASLSRAYVSLMGKLQRLSPLYRAGALGFLSALLPCGWLYAYVMVAAGTGSAWGGALAMSAFWAGTLPALTLLSVLLGRLQSGVLLNLRRAMPLLLITMGLLTAFSRASVQLENTELARAAQETSTAHARRVATQTPACCKEQNAREASFP